ncbi:MAG: sugar phosphate isomerase/epimerase family protein [Mangrovibacterium sp.]
MKRILLLSVLLLAGAVYGSGLIKKSDWQLGLQSYTYHRFTFVETLEQLEQLGIQNVEVYFGQQLGEGFTGTMDYHMDEATRKKLLGLVHSKGIKIVSCGVVICDSPEEWERLFSFADQMGIPMISSEPALADLDYVEKLADRYKIDVAFHNHPKPSEYWDPSLLVKALKGRSKRLGSCADVGHWKRMGFDPVEALKMLEGRIKTLHFKDIGEGGAQAHDVIWGTGLCKVEGMMKELKRQGFKGTYLIEYEYNEDNPTPDVKECIRYYQSVADKLF